MNKYFYFLYGRQNAVYIIYLETVTDILDSLSFYKDLNIKSKLTKATLYSYSHVLRFLIKLLPSIGKNNNEVQNFLVSKIGYNCDFGITEHCSCLISPTRDKVIVHHHGQYFQKYGFGQSYLKLKNEYEIYQHLEGDYQYLSISKAKQYEDNERFCSFRLYTDKSCNRHTLLQIYNDILLNSLVEFNKALPRQERTVSEYFEGILHKIKGSDLKLRAQSIIDKFGKEKLLSGLTHNDFKPWNVLVGEEKTLFFDFEECTANGIIGTDFFNYFIDPVMLNFKGLAKVEKAIEHHKVKDAFEKYSKEFAFKSPYYLVLSMYLLDRCFKYEVEKNTTMRARYMGLFEIIRVKLT